MRNSQYKLFRMTRTPIVPITTQSNANQTGNFTESTKKRLRNTFCVRSCSTTGTSFWSNGKTRSCINFYKRPATHQAASKQNEVDKDIEEVKEAQTWYRTQKYGKHQFIIIRRLSANT